MNESQAPTVKRRPRQQTKTNNSTNMKTALGIIIAIALGFALSGCDPTKTGGGGQQQPYSPDNGHYK